MNEIGKRIHLEQDSFKAFCEKYRRLYMFGNGIVATFMYRYCVEENVKINGIVLSQKSSDVFYGISVKSLDEMSFSTNDGVILAVGDSLKQECLQILLDSGITREQIYVQNMYWKYSCAEMPEILKLDILIKNGPYFDNYVELNCLGEKYGTDKAEGLNNYLKKYEFFLRSKKSKQMNVLELGVAKGASIKMLGEYFHNADIYGVDIGEDCIKYEGENRKVLIEDLGNEEVLAELANLEPEIVIDDASHFWSHQIKALCYLFSALRGGGIYIVEDLGTSFYEYSKLPYCDATLSTYEFLQEICKCVCSNERIDNCVAKRIYDVKEEIEKLASQIDMISFIKGSCIIIKK